MRIRIYLAQLTRYIFDLELPLFARNLFLAMTAFESKLSNKINSKPDL